MAKSTIKYIDFFAPESKDTFYLSNFYPLKPPMVIDGETWHTTEHYFQAMKFRGPKATPRMLEYSNTIRDSKTGNMAKMLGAQKQNKFRGSKWEVNGTAGDHRLINNVIEEYKDVKMREDWDKARLFVMVDAVLHKFSEPKLNALITALPPNTIFREASPFDVIWGVGKAGTGLNYLGKILTAVSYGLRGIPCGTLSGEMGRAIRIRGESKEDQREDVEKPSSKHANECKIYTFKDHQWSKPTKSFCSIVTKDGDQHFESDTLKFRISNSISMSKHDDISITVGIKGNVYAIRFSSSKMLHEFEKIVELDEGQPEDIDDLLATLDEVDKEAGSLRDPRAVKPSKESWQCKECLVDNPMNLDACRACETKRKSDNPPATAVCIKVDALRKASGDRSADLRKWMEDPNNIYVGRHGRIFIDKEIFPYKGSKWANPYKVGPKDYTLEESIRLYRKHLVDSGLINDIHELDGKQLGCFCDQSDVCHAQVLAELANAPHEEVVNFTRTQLTPNSWIDAGQLPVKLYPDFNALWALHPEKRDQFMGNPVPRWIQSYGVPYTFSGKVHNALPIPEILHPIHEWVDNLGLGKFNQVLVNWYKDQNDSISAHSDNEGPLLKNSPIVSVSFGANRTFAIQNKETKGKKMRIKMPDGTVLIMGGAMQSEYTHEVPKEPKEVLGPRINLTFRQFKKGGVSEKGTAE